MPDEEKPNAGGWYIGQTRTRERWGQWIGRYDSLPWGSERYVTRDGEELRMILAWDPDVYHDSQEAVEHAIALYLLKHGG